MKKLVSAALTPTTATKSLPLENKRKKTSIQLIVTWTVTWRNGWDVIILSLSCVTEVFCRLDRSSQISSHSAAITIPMLNWLAVNLVAVSLPKIQIQCQCPSDYPLLERWRSLFESLDTGTHLKWWKDGLMMEKSKKLPWPVGHLSNKEALTVEYLPQH